MPINCINMKYLNPIRMLPFASLLVAALPAQAAIVLTFAQTGDAQTTVTVSGSLSAGFTYIAQESNNTMVFLADNPKAAIGINGSSEEHQAPLGELPPPEVPWGGMHISENITGDTVGFMIDATNVSIFVPQGYAFGSPLTSTWVLDASLADLGFSAQQIADGASGSINLIHDTATWVVIPEPGTYAALLGVLVLGVALLRRSAIDRHRTLS